MIGLGIGLLSLLPFVGILDTTDFRKLNFVGPLCRHLASDEFCNRRRQTLWNDHDRLATRTKGRFILRDRFVFSLFFVMLQDGSHSCFIPTCGKLVLLCHHFFPIRLVMPSSPSWAWFSPVSWHAGQAHGAPG